MQGLAPFNRVHLPCGGPTPKPLGARAGGHSFARTVFARDKSRGETRKDKERQGETRIDKERQGEARIDKERQTARFRVVGPFAASPWPAERQRRDNRSRCADAPNHRHAAAKMKDAPVQGPRRSLFT